jgi:hypothetical protein
MEVSDGGGDRLHTFCFLAWGNLVDYGSGEVSDGHR